MLGVAPIHSNWNAKPATPQVPSLVSAKNLPSECTLIEDESRSASLRLDWQEKSPDYVSSGTKGATKTPAVQMETSEQSAIASGTGPRRKMIRSFTADPMS